MSATEIIELISLIITAVGLIASLVTSITRGKLKVFVIEKMEEAEASGKEGKEKLQYVLDAVNKEYKILTIFMNIRKFIEEVIKVTKNINAK